MRAYRTGDSRHPAADGASPYADLLAQGPPSTRPRADGEAPDDGTADGAAPHDGTADGAAPHHGAPSDRGPASAADPADLSDGHVASGSRHEVTVVQPGELSPRRPPRRPTPAAARAPAPRRTPRRRRGSFRPYYTLAAWLVLGLGIGGAFLVGVALDRLGAWDHEVRLEEQTELTFPRSQERWIWLPEERTGDVVCTATDGTGADLPMRPALGYDHDGYVSAFRFPTGDGGVTLRCDPAPSPATPGWTPSGTETVRVAEPVDRAGDLPFLQASLILTLGGPLLGVLVLVGTLLTHAVTKARDAVRRRR